MVAGPAQVLQASFYLYDVFGLTTKPVAVPATDTLKVPVWAFESVRASLKVNQFSGHFWLSWQLQQSQRSQMDR